MRRWEPGARRVRGSLLWLLLVFGCDDSGTPTLSSEPAAWPQGQLIAVELIDHDRAVVANTKGRIHTTQDGGNHWMRARAPAIDGLVDLSFAADGVGWGVARGGVIRSEDAGQHWRWQRLPLRASELDLLGGFAFDSRRGVLFDRRGRLLWTDDGGAEWRVEELTPFEGGGALVAFDCKRESISESDRGRCWWASEERVYAYPDGLRASRAIAIRDALDLASIEFEDGLQRVDPNAASALRERVASHPRVHQLVASVDVRLSTSEFHAIEDARDTSGLFALLEARGEDVREVLEQAGFAPGATTIANPPPWDFEDLADEISGLRDRYLEGRLAERAAARIRVRERTALEAMAVGLEGEAIAIGQDGRGLRSSQLARGFDAVVDWALRGTTDVAIGAERWVVVGLDSDLWTSPDRGGTWQPVTIDREDDLAPDLAEVAFDPSGEVGLIVGDQGTILTTRDGGVSWTQLAPDSRPKATAPIIR